MSASGGAPGAEPGTDRIFVTGVGLVTPLGLSVESTWGPLVAGARGISELTLFDVEAQRTRLAAEVRGLTLPDGPPRAWSRSAAMAQRAAAEALAGARLDVRGERARRVGLVIGGTTGGMFETEPLLARLHADPQERDALREMLSHPLTATGDRLHEVLGPFVRVRSLCSACSSGANAWIVAAEWLLSGDVDAVVAGGSDGLCRLTYTGFNALGAIDPGPCKPFDRARRGLTLGEGSGFAVLERASAARARGAAPIAELAGWSLGAEGHHITNPEPSGERVSRLMGSAIARAGLAPRDIDYVNAHGTGTPANDPMEVAALRRALGAEIERVPVSSSKGQLGHTLGGAGAIEAVITALCVARGAIVPTAGLEEADPACALLHVPRAGRSAKVRAAMSNSFGFGGMDAVLVLSEPELGPPKRQEARRVVVTGVSTLTPAGLGGLSISARVAGGPPAARLDVTPEVALDAARARRLDPPARLVTAVAERALAEARLTASGGPEPGLAVTGLVFGSAFGSIDASAAFMHRVFEKGPRLASPAEFPNLVPSSPVGHASIYLGLRGAAFATADLAASGESAFAQAVQLVRGGEAERLVAGSVEERSDIVRRVLSVLFARSREQGEAERACGAAGIVVESEAAAVARGAPVLARVERVIEWRDDEVGRAELQRLPPPGPRARVILPDELNPSAVALLRETAWRDAPRDACSAAAGEHDGLGAVAIASGAAKLALGEAGEILVLGLAMGRGDAVVLAAP